MTEEFELADEPQSWPVVSSSVVHRSYVETVRVDELTVPGSPSEPFQRDVIAHLGAVAVLAVNDQDEILLVRQYRHPAQHALVEIPAGLRDAAGEPPVETARRELREEGYAEADTWSLLLDVFTSPGLSDERVQVFLAEGARTVGQAPGFLMEHEESLMTRGWVAYAEVLDAVLDGRVSNGITASAVTALAARRARGASRRATVDPAP